MIELLKSGNEYKANLHCHTVCSDGKKTPEEIKALYKGEGYSVVAFTDHEVFIPHNDLTDEEFLALNGLETQVFQGEKWTKRTKCCHLCMIALSPDTVYNPIWDRKRVYVGCVKPQYIAMNAVSDSDPDFERVYTGECVSKMISIAKKKGFFVTYNHPVWSLESYPEYMSYNGMNALEIVNGGCITEGSQDRNERVYDDMLRGGKVLTVVAADDNHNAHPIGSPRSDSFIGFTVIRADKLDYQSVTKALVNGDSYASEGPRFKEIIYDPDKQEVHVSFTPASVVYATSAARYIRNRFAEECENGVLTEATFKIYPDDDYFRLTVTDLNGKSAFSNAYSVSELLNLKG